MSRIAVALAVHSPLPHSWYCPRLPLVPPLQTVPDWSSLPHSFWKSASRGSRGVASKYEKRAQKKFCEVGQFIFTSGSPTHAAGFLSDARFGQGGYEKSSNHVMNLLSRIKEG